MNQLIHVCLFNREPDANRVLAKALSELNFVRLEAEVDSAEALGTLLEHARIQLIFFHLDPNPDAVLPVIGDVSVRFPEIGMIAVSHQTGPEAILGPMRAGCDQFVCEPIDADDLSTAVGRVAAKRLFMQPKSKRIAVIGASGGAGTTSIVCNLALEIGDISGKNCAAVDLDFQFGDVAMNFDCEPKYTWHDLASVGQELDQGVLEQTLVTLPCKVAVLARPERIEESEHISPETVRRVLEMLANHYENVVMDVPRALSPVSELALSRADLILIISQLMVPSIRNAKRVLIALQSAGIPEERIRFVVNRADPRGNGRITIKDLEETVNKAVFACVPNDYQFVARSIDFGRPIAALDRNSAVRAAIRDIAKLLIAEDGKPGAKKSRRKGFFSRLLTK
jgi:pilus assembly protein CpaE